MTACEPITRHDRCHPLPGDHLGPARRVGTVEFMLDSARDKLGQALFAKVAGPDGPSHRSRIHDTEGPRWFGPDDAIVRVHGDASMFIGGLRALMLQSLHPSAMRAVSEHSGFRGDMWGRLSRTSRFLAVTTFGTVEHAESSIRMVRGIHAKISGTLSDGTPYRASDPHLLAWVHLAEIDSFLRAHSRYGREPLDQAGRDEYVAQTAVVAGKLGVIDPPTTEAALAEALAAYRPELRGTSDAREALSFLLLRPPLPMVARAPYAVLTAAAVAMMPAWTRLPLRLPWLPVAERTVVRLLGQLATGTIRWAMAAPAAQPAG